MVGLGYRKDFSKEFLTSDILHPDFVEVAPENWIDLGGYWKRELRKIAENYPIYCHGLSLSIGSPDPIDFNFLSKIKSFLEEYDVKIYSEHLSFSKIENAHLYDLLPIPFTKDAITHVVENIIRVQDVLKRKLVIENVSYYTTFIQEMTEVEFINEIAERSDCELLLDVNNIYVNSFNHVYNAKEFIDNINLEKVNYIHMAGHEQVSDTLIIDTHGEAIIDPVFDLYDYAIKKLNRKVPTLLERDFNIPDLQEMENEMNQLREIQTKNLFKNETAK
jgi:uncharacterized protein